MILQAPTAFVTVHLRHMTPDPGDGCSTANAVDPVMDVLWGTITFRWVTVVPEAPTLRAKDARREVFHEASIADEQCQALEALVTIFLCFLHVGPHVS